MQEIIDIEKIKYINGNTHNIFFEGNVWLQASHIIQIFGDDNLANKAIRVIYSYANDEYGKFKKLLIDEITQQSGKKQLYYKNMDDKATAYFHKMIFNKFAEFGDNVLTARGYSQYAEISRCVREFAKNLNEKINSGTSVPNAIDELLNDRLSLSSFDDSQNIKWYIVKYSEFLYDKLATSLSVLRRKNYGGTDVENIYDIQCLSNTDNDFNKEHYHPFYLALSHKLDNRITIDEATLKYMGAHIEYVHPCILSNGWRIQIDGNGDWIIDFKGNCPSDVILGCDIDLSGTGKIDCKGKDSIEYMANFLNSL